MSHTTVVRPPTPSPIARYGGQSALALTTAFTLSVTHTVYAQLSGLASPGFTVDSPLTWTFYAVGFLAAAAARRPDPWVHRALVAYLAVMLWVSMFVYPATFEPYQQTAFAWFENDVYVSLLVLSFYLTVQRLRGVSLVDDAVEPVAPDAPARIRIAT